MNLRERAAHSSVAAQFDQGRAAGFTNHQKSAQALASDVSTAIIAIIKAPMMIMLPTITSQLVGPEIRLMAL